MRRRCRPAREWHDPSTGKTFIFVDWDTLEIAVGSPKVLLKAHFPGIDEPMHCEKTRLYHMRSMAKPGTFMKMQILPPRSNWFGKEFVFYEVVDTIPPDTTDFRL